MGEASPRSQQIASAAAEDFVSGRSFREGLMVLQTEGKPLWDGKTKIYVREAFPEEQATSQISRARVAALQRYIFDIHCLMKVRRFPR